jgi:hypothetical protein
MILGVHTVHILGASRTASACAPLQNDDAYVFLLRFLEAYKTEDFDWLDNPFGLNTFNVTRILAVYR